MDSPHRQLTILDLSWRSRSSGGGQLTENGSWRWPSVPYLIVNCVFRCDPGYYHDKALARSQDYKQVVLTGSPEEEEREFQERVAKFVDAPSDWITDLAKQEPKPMGWTYDHASWHHIEKFDVFWFREWISDCPVTRAAIQELRLYQLAGGTGSVYRSEEEEVILNHLETLQRYWD